MESALEQLRERGEAFRLTARCLGNRFIDVEGRTIGGRAILRLRDVTGDRAELLQAQAKLATARSDLRSMTMLLDDVAYPALDPRRGRPAALGEPGLSALRRGHGSSTMRSAAPSSCSSAPTREEARRQRQAGATFASPRDRRRRRPPRACST